MCHEKHRLLEEYDTATVRLLQAVDVLVEAPEPERDRLKRIAEDARTICGETMAALLAHRLAHAG